MDPRKGFREKCVASDAAFPQMQLLLGLAGFQVQVHNVFEGSQPLRKPQRRMRCVEDSGRTHVIIINKVISCSAVGKKRLHLEQTLFSVPLDTFSVLG